MTMVSAVVRRAIARPLIRLRSARTSNTGSSVYGPDVSLFRPGRYLGRHSHHPYCSPYITGESPLVHRLRPWQTCDCAYVWASVRCQLLDPFHRAAAAQAAGGGQG